MEIKQLEWLRNPRAMEAHTPFGTYTIYSNSDRKFTVTLGCDTINRECENHVLARKFAQDDFENKIKECLIIDNDDKKESN